MKSPAFQFYPQDFISSLDVQMMSVEEVGGYCLLLFNSWIQDEQGYLPDNPELLRHTCRMTKSQWQKFSPNILKKFSKKDGKIFNERLIKELSKQKDFREKQALNGSKGGRPKILETHEKAVGLPNETHEKAKKTSSSSSSFSSSITKEIVIRIINYLNKKTDKSYSSSTTKTIQLITARLKEGFKEEDFYTVIDHKTEKWLSSPEFNPYLRPDTLFSNKFEGYLNEKPNAKILPLNEKSKEVYIAPKVNLNVK